MTLAELDALIEANPKARHLMLAYADWHLIETQDALPHRQLRPDGLGYIYRGLRVWVISPGPTRLSEGSL